MSPQWQEEQAAARRRACKPATCTGCGAALLVGQGDDFDDRKVAVDADPIPDDRRLLLVALALLTARPVYGRFYRTDLCRLDRAQLGLSGPASRWATSPGPPVPLHLHHSCPTPTPREGRS